jgi:hypothetical protein
MKPSCRTNRRRLKHAGSLKQLIEILQSCASSTSIMTPWNSVHAIDAPSNSRDARERTHLLMNEHQYSGVPLVHLGRILGVYMRHNATAMPRHQAATPSLFFDPESGPLELLKHMCDTSRIAVALGSANRPVGWVTYADFSKRAFRVLLFAIIAEVELLLATAIDVAYPDDSWVTLLDRDHQEQIRGAKARLGIGTR